MLQKVLDDLTEEETRRLLNGCLGILTFCENWRDYVALVRDHLQEGTPEMRDDLAHTISWLIQLDYDLENAN